MTKVLIVSILLTMLLSPVQTLHIDHDAPVVPAGTTERKRYPAVCDPSLPHAIQFRWVTAPGEGVDRVAIEERLRGVAEEVNWLFWRDSDSATEARLPAWKVTADCRLDVSFEERAGWGGTVPPPSDGQTKVIEVSPAPGYYCGWAFVTDDDRPGPENVHNAAAVAWVARGCLSYYVVGHELLHLLGAVQRTAPHSDGWFHSREFDVMGRPEADRCGVHDMIDCGHDDYFSLTPTGYLAERWNVANSVFLVKVGRVTVWAPMAMR